MPELHLPGRGACSENLFEVRPSFLWHLGVLGMAKQLVFDIGREVVHFLACGLFPS